MTTFSNPAFQQKNVNSAFNLINQNQANNFDAFFEVKPLDNEEANRIDKLLLDNFNLTSGISDENDKQKISEDSAKLKELTAQVKAIGKQGIILLGERIQKAGEILKSYKDGTYAKWMEITFGSRKTAYNALNYYEFYEQLPSHDLKTQFKKMPLKAAYVLASRNGPIEKKSEIILHHHNDKPEEIVGLIQEFLPLTVKDKRRKKDANTRILDEMAVLLKNFKEEKIN